MGKCLAGFLTRAAEAAPRYSVDGRDLNSYPATSL